MAELNKIMAVEDEADIRMVLEVALRDVADFDLQVCSSGAEALELAPSFQPDLILLDVMMPDMDGPDTLEALRELPETAETPVIFLTAKVQSREVQRFREIGAIGVIAKPFDPMDLAEEVRRVWGGGG
ncbi:MAG: response regulator [Longimicrobiales bacterium]